MYLKMIKYISWIFIVNIWKNDIAILCWYSSGKLFCEFITLKSTALKFWNAVHLKCRPHADHIQVFCLATMWCPSYSGASWAVAFYAWHPSRPQILSRCNCLMCPTCNVEGIAWWLSEIQRSAHWVDVSVQMLDPTSELWFVQLLSINFPYRWMEVKHLITRNQRKNPTIGLKVL